MEPKVVRSSAEALERVLAEMPRASERTREWLRDHFVGGRSVPEIASTAGVPVQHVANKVRPVGVRLAETASGENVVRVTLSLPAALGHEVAALAAALEHRTPQSDAAIKPVLRAIAAAREKLGAAG